MEPVEYHYHEWNIFVDLYFDWTRAILFAEKGGERQWTESMRGHLT